MEAGNNDENSKEEEPRRRQIAGPVSLSTLTHSKKALADLTKSFFKTVGSTRPSEEITVHTKTPQLEHRHVSQECRQIYQGDINILSLIETDKDITCCKYNESQSEIGAGFSDGVIKMFDCATGACTRSLTDDEGRAYPGPVTAITHRPVSEAHPVTETFLASYVNGCIKFWKYKFSQCVYTIREKRQALGLCYHPRLPKFVTYGDDARLNMYDEEMHTQERSFYSSGFKNVVDGHSSKIFACVFNPRSHHELISGGWDDRVFCWDDRTPFATKHIQGVHMCAEGLDFDRPAGRQILTCSWEEENSIRLWDYGSGKLIEAIQPDAYNSKLYCGRFVPKTSLMICGGSDANIIRLVDLKTKTTECSIRNNPAGIVGFDFGRKRRKPPRSSDRDLAPPPGADVPTLTFFSGRRLQAIDFG